MAHYQTKPTDIEFVEAIELLVPITCDEVEGDVGDFLVTQRSTGEQFIMTAEQFKEQYMTVPDVVPFPPYFNPYPVTPYVQPYPAWITTTTNKIPYNPEAEYMLFGDQDGNIY